MYKTIVIGRGMIGTPAARYLAQASDGIALVGPDEPSDYSGHEGVFASHYDQGRITRVVDPKPEWAEAGRQSILCYRELEQQSGIRFYYNVGHLSIERNAKQFPDHALAALDPVGIESHRLTAREIRARFPFLNIDDSTLGVLEPNEGGYINPRSMIAAQGRLFEMAGGTMIRETVVGLSDTPKGVELTLSDGRQLEAERVLLATGAFGEATGLDLSRLGLRVYARTVILARIDGSLCNELANMPSIIQMPEDYYLLPPIEYPDGQTYVKIGQGLDSDPQLRSLDDIRQWFKGPGLEANLNELPSALRQIIPSLERATEWHSANCVTTYTPNGLPCIDYLHGNKIAVAIGGNGKAAKSGDYWGRLAADLILGRNNPDSIAPQKLKLPA